MLVNNWRSNHKLHHNDKEIEMSFEGKVVLVIGASSGIGADAARHLAKLGAKVSIVGRNEERLNKVAEQIKSSGSPSPLPIIADATKDAERIVDETIKHFGKLDVLVNAAGVYKHDNISTMEMTDFEKTFMINVQSVITLTKLCAPYLEKTKGNIVNVSSVAGMRACSHSISCSISKAALDQFTKCAALDLASKGIRVNSINPGFIRTPLFETSGFSAEKIEQMYVNHGNKYPVGRIGEVMDTSEAIAFLANDKSASFITGLLLPVDGGRFVAGV